MTVRVRSSICAVVRDEDRIILDWLVHHLLIGVDKIVVYDDCSVLPIEQKLSSLPDTLRRRIEVIRFPSDLYLDPSKLVGSQVYDESVLRNWGASKQFYTYNHFLKTRGKTTDWVAFIDGDEFLWPGAHGSLPALLDRLEAAQAESVILNMSLYGHNYKLLPFSESPLLRNIRRMRKLWGHGKLLVRPKVIEAVNNPHYPLLRSSKRPVDVSYTEQDGEFFETSHIHDGSVDLDVIPHIKHYFDYDALSSIRRRLRTRISGFEEPFSYSADRLALLPLCNEVVDPSMAFRACSFAALVGGSAQEAYSVLREELSLSHREKVPILNFTSYARHFGLPPDMEALDLYKHWATNFRPGGPLPEFVLLPEGFDVERYQQLNADLAGLSEDELKIQYHLYGQHEGRQT